jgi:hypothetical protein
MSIAHDRGRTTQASARVDPLSGLYARPPGTKDPKVSAIGSGGAGRAIGIPKREAHGESKQSRFRRNDYGEVLG